MPSGNENEQRGKNCSECKKIKPIVFVCCIFKGSTNYTEITIIPAYVYSLNYVIDFHSELLLLASIVEEIESWVDFSVKGVGEAESGLGVVG